MAEADEVNKLAEATKKLREAEEKLAYARSDEAKEVAKLEKQTQALTDQTRAIEQSYAQWSDLGKELKDGLFAPLKGIVSAIPGPLRTIGKMIAKGAMDLGSLVGGKREKNPQLEKMNKGIQELVKQGEGPDSSVATETSLEGGDGGGAVPKPDKGGPFGKAFKAIGAWIKKFLTWKTLIIGVLAAIVGGLAIKYWEPIKEIVLTIKDKVMGIYNTIKEWFVSLWDWGIAKGTDEDGKWSVTTFVLNTWNSIKEWVMEKFAWAGDIVAEGWTTLTDFIRGIYTDTIDFWKRKFAAIGDLAVAGWTTLKDFVTGIYTDTIDFWKRKFTAIGDLAVEGWTTLKDFITGIYTDTIDFWKRKFAAIGDLAVQGWTNLKDFVTDAFESVVFFFQDMFRWSKNIVVEGFHNLTDFIIDTYNKVVEFFTRMFKWGGDIIKEGWNGVTGFVTGVYDQVIDFFTRMFAWGGDIVKEGWTGLTTFVTDAYDKVIDFFTRMFAWGGDIVKEGWNGVTGFVTGVYDQVIDFFTRMFTWGGDIIKEGWNGVTGFITDAYDNIVGFFTDKFNFVSDAIEGFSLIDTIRQTVQNIKDFFFNDEGTGLLDFDFSGFSMPDFNLNAMTEKIKDLVRGIVDFLPDFLVPDKIAEWLELPPQPPVAEADFTLPLAGGAEIVAEPTTAEMANKVYRGAGPNRPGIINAPTTAVDASSASSTVNVFQRGRPGASDGYTIAQGRNQRTRFSN